MRVVIRLDIRSDLARSSVTRADREGISRLVDERFDGAFELEQQRKELPHVRWGRLDYLNVTAITTKWVVWR